MANEVTNLHSLINALGTEIFHSAKEVSRILNDRYISVQVTDERVVRGNLPYDILNKSNIYEVVRITDEEKIRTLDVEGIPTILQEGTHFELISLTEVSSESVCFVEPFMFITDHHPIQNIISVLNQTTGEKYVVESISDDKVIVSGRVIPATDSVTDEEHFISGNRTIILDNAPVIEITDAHYIENSVSIGLQFKIINKLNGVVSILTDFGESFNPETKIYVSYSYMSDVVLVDYEHGRNAISWSISGDQYLQEEDVYYVTYKYGARRQQLYQNFGYLLGLSRLSELSAEAPNSWTRKTYRAAIGAAGEAAINGATLDSMKKIVHVFTDVDPIIKEGFKTHWTLGETFLYSLAKQIGTLEYAAGKFSSGVLISRDNVINNIYPSIRYGAAGNIKLTKGTLQVWILPRWRIDTYNHYIFDMQGDLDNTKNRMRLYKAFDGYLYFELYGYDSQLIQVKFDVSGIERDAYDQPVNSVWLENDPHFITIDWEQLLDGYEEIYTVIQMTIDDFNKSGNAVLPVATAFGSTYISRVPSVFSIGSDANAMNQADAVLDELRITGSVRTAEQKYSDYMLGEPFSSYELNLGGETKGSFETYILCHFENTIESAQFIPIFPGSEYEYVDGRFNKAVVLSKSALVIDI